LDAAKLEVHGGADAGRRLTFGQLAELWLANRKGKIRWRTWKEYGRVLHKHGKDLWRRPLVAIKPLDLDVHLRDLERSGVPSAARMVYRGRLRQVLRYAVAKRLLPLSPADSLEVPKHEPAARTTWERSEVAAFLAVARGVRLFPAFYLALATGLRPGEVLALQWADLDLDAGTLAVRHTWVPGENGHGLGKPKTPHSQREIPLSRDVVEVLVAWRAAWLAERVYEVGVEVDDLDLVFSWPNGRPMSASTFARWQRRIIAVAGVPALSLHGMRHTFATLALHAGMPVQVLSERLGHTRSSFTLDVYVGVLAEQREQAVFSMDRLLSEPEATRKLHSGTAKQLPPN
jgi:integrase